MSPTPNGPITEEPTLPDGQYVTAQDLDRMLREVLGDVELGEYDERVIGWLSMWPYETVVTVASWIERARRSNGEPAEVGASKPRSKSV